MTADWEEHPARIAEEIRKINTFCEKVAWQWKEDAIALATLNQNVGNIERSVHRLEEFGLKTFIAIMTVVAGWVISSIHG